MFFLILGYAIISAVPPKGGSFNFEESRKSEEEIDFLWMCRKFNDKDGNDSATLDMGY